MTAGEAPDGPARSRHRRLARLGRAIALALAREGAHVIIAARTTGALEELDDEIRAVGGTATILKLDLRAGDRSISSARRSISAGASSTSSWPRPAFSVPFRRCRTSPRTLGRRHRRQPQRQLAPHPHARSAAEDVGCRPRDVRDVGRRHRRHGLLGAVRGVEGGARDAGHEPTPRNARTTAVRVATSSIPVPCARTCAPRLSRARIRGTLPRPTRWRRCSSSWRYRPRHRNGEVVSFRDWALAGRAREQQRRLTARMRRPHLLGVIPARAPPSLPDFLKFCLDGWPPSCRRHVCDMPRA